LLRARLQPDKIGVRDSQRALTFGQWNERASRLAKTLDLKKCYERASSTAA